MNEPPPSNLQWQNGRDATEWLGQTGHTGLPGQAGGVSYAKLEEFIPKYKRNSAHLPSRGGPGGWRGSRGLGNRRRGESGTGGGERPFGGLGHGSRGPGWSPGSGRARFSQQGNNGQQSTGSGAQRQSVRRSHQSAVSDVRGVKTLSLGRVHNQADLDEDDPAAWARDGPQLSPRQNNPVRGGNPRGDPLEGWGQHNLAAPQNINVNPEPAPSGFASSYATSFGRRTVVGRRRDDG